MREFLIALKETCPDCKGLGVKTEYKLQVWLANRGHSSTECPLCGGYGYTIKEVKLIDALQELGYKSEGCDNERK